jgi:hypothetical protein
MIYPPVAKRKKLLFSQTKYNQELPLEIRYACTNGFPKLL